MCGRLVLLLTCSWGYRIADSSQGWIRDNQSLLMHDSHMSCPSNVLGVSELSCGPHRLMDVICVRKSGQCIIYDV